MKLVFHGGKCCGIKTIHTFPHNIDTMVEKLNAIQINNSDRTRRGGPPGARFFHEAAPTETGIERLDRYIEYCKRRRPKGMIEVVLADNPLYPGYDQTKYWRDPLENRGFVQVAKFLNSNSGNNCYVFHLVYEMEEAKPEPVPQAQAE